MLYRRRLRQKAVLLLCMLAFLMILMMWTERKPEEEDPKKGEELVIPESEEEITVLPGETWQLPGGDAKIRVLLLGEDGSIYHKTQKPDREYPGELYPSG